MHWWLCLFLLVAPGCLWFGGDPLNGVAGGGNFPPQATVHPVLTGHVVAGNTSFSRVFVSFERVVLYAGDRIVAETSTDTHGNFAFYAQISDGRYQIAVQSERYRGSLSVLFRGDPLSGLEVVVTTKDPR